MQVAVSRIITGLIGVVLAAWGIALVVDYLLPGWLWRVSLVLAAVLLGLFLKAVYDGRLR